MWASVLHRRPQHRLTSGEMVIGHQTRNYRKKKKNVCVESMYIEFNYVLLSENGLNQNSKKAFE